MLTVKEINMVLENKLSKRTRMTLIGVCVGVLLVGVGVFVYLSFFAKHPSTSESLTPQYETVPTDSNDGKTAKDTDNSTSADSTTTTQRDTTSNQVPVASSGSVAITTLNQSNGYINAKAVVSNFSTTQCVYSFAASEAKPVIRQINGECTGISIPQSEFEFIGTYTLTVTAYNGTSQKVSVSKDIAVR